MEPNPDGFVPFESQHSMQSFGADSIFLADYVPDSPKPKLQRFAGILKNGARNQGGLIAAIGTMEQLSFG
jgi:hypothetical protein